MSKKLVLLFFVIFLFVSFFSIIPKTHAIQQNELISDKTIAVADNKDKIIVTFYLHNWNWLYCTSIWCEDGIRQTTGNPGQLQVSGTSNKVKLISSTSYISNCDDKICDISYIWELTSGTAEKKTITYFDSEFVKKSYTLEVTFTKPASSTPQSNVSNALKPASPKMLTINDQKLSNDNTLDQSIAEGNYITIAGTAPANASIKLYVSSEEIIAETKADKSGNWIYTLSNPLTPGEHKVEGQTINASGIASDRILLAKFTVVAKKSTIQTAPHTAPQTTPQEDVMKPWMWILIAIAVILFMVIIYLYIRSRKKSNSIVQ